jgi:hypothetical protein
MEKGPTRLKCWPRTIGCRTFNCRAWPRNSCL